jgi:hypothetical protein
VTCLPALLTASVVIAASLLGGCSDTAIGTAGGEAGAPAPARAAAQTTNRAAPVASGQPMGEQLASAALDDRRLSEVRGGFETSSGVVLNFAFQQATYVNHQLVESIVVPTMTISPSSLGGLGAASQAAAALSGATVLPNGTVQAQVSAAAPVIQALVNSGMTSIVSTLGNGGLTSVISNAANNQLIQQMNTLNIGVTGLSNMIQQSVASTVLNRLTGPSALR